MFKSEIPFFDSPYVLHHWNVILHRDNQSYLGRCIVFLKSRITDDPLSLTADERDELWFDILPRLKHALEKSFSPDRINYSHLANAEHFVHWHVIPRYEQEPTRTFANETFTDERVGKHYAPSPLKQLPSEVMAVILAELKKNF